MASADLQKFLMNCAPAYRLSMWWARRSNLSARDGNIRRAVRFTMKKTPSFTVNEAKGFYHCFGCGAHGDIIKFEMEANNLPFMDAVHKLADKAGLRVPQLSHENREEIEKRASQYDIMEMAAKFF